MDIFLALLGFALVILGIIGAFLPVLPGPLTGWFGLLLLHLTKVIPLNWTFLGITLALAILIGAFLGAFVGELLYDSKDTNRALKASFGSFLGFLTSATIKFMVSIIYFVLFIIKFWEYKEAFIS